ECESCSCLAHRERLIETCTDASCEFSKQTTARRLCGSGSNRSRSNRSRGLLHSLNFLRRLHLPSVENLLHRIEHLLLWRRDAVLEFRHPRSSRLTCGK